MTITPEASDTEKNISGLFAEARKHERAVLFLDECEALLRRRGHQKIAAVEQFLAETDGVQETSNCMLLLLATNRPWMMDEAVTRPGRIGVQIYVGSPDEAARAAIIEYSLRDVPLNDDVDIGELARRTERYSGADLGSPDKGSVCSEARLSAAKRQTDLVKAAKANGLTQELTEVVTMADFEYALRKVKPSITDNVLAEFDKWRESRDHAPDDADDD